MDNRLGKSVHRSLALMVAIAACWAAQASGQGSVQGSEEDCARTEARRAEAAKTGNFAGLEGLARWYISNCRAIRPKAAVSIAMEEIAYARRNNGPPSEAMRLAQDCISFDWLAAGCHVEKARALTGMRLRSEAAEVYRTASDVIEKLERQADYNLRLAESNRKKLPPSEYEAMTVQASMQLATARRARRMLAQDAAEAR